MKTKTWKTIQADRARLTLLDAKPESSFHERVEALEDFRRYERRLSKLAEISCNGYPKPQVEYRDGKMFVYNVEDLELKARCEKKEKHYEELATKLARAFNLDISFQGDPRGLAFELKTKKGVSVNFYVDAI